MESTENNFFHLIVAALLFIAAVAVLLLGVKRIELAAKVQQEALTDETLFETTDGETLETVSADYILSLLMSELSYDVRIDLKNGRSYEYQAGSIGLAVGELPELSNGELLLHYEYTRYGKMQAVHFLEQ